MSQPGPEKMQNAENPFQPKDPQAQGFLMPTQSRIYPTPGSLDNFQQQGPAPATPPPFQSDYRNVVQFLVILSSIHNIFLLIFAIVYTVKTLWILCFHYLPRDEKELVVLFFFVYFFMTLSLSAALFFTTQVWNATKLGTPPSQGCRMFRGWIVMYIIFIVVEAIIVLVFSFWLDILASIFGSYIGTLSTNTNAIFSMTLRIVSLRFVGFFQKELQDASFMVQPPFMGPKGFPGNPQSTGQIPSKTFPGQSNMSYPPPVTSSTSSPIPLQSQQSVTK